jgi:hypothetical protein
MAERTINITIPPDALREMQEQIMQARHAWEAEVQERVGVYYDPSRAPVSIELEATPEAWHSGLWVENHRATREGYIVYGGERLPIDRVERDGDRVTVYLRQEPDPARIQAMHRAEYEAERLLMSNLSPEQRMDFTQHRHFDVISQSGKRFRIHAGRSQNIYGLDRRGDVISTHCIVAERDIPICDQLLMQKLVLEYDEQRFINEAVSRFYGEENHRVMRERMVAYGIPPFDYRT